MPHAPCLTLNSTGSLSFYGLNELTNGRRTRPFRLQQKFLCLFYPCERYRGFSGVIVDLYQQNAG